MRSPTSPQGGRRSTLPTLARLRTKAVDDPETNWIGDAKPMWSALLPVQPWAATPTPVQEHRDRTCVGLICRAAMAITAAKSTTGCGCAIPATSFYRAASARTASQLRTVRTTCRSSPRFRLKIPAPAAARGRFRDGRQPPGMPSRHAALANASTPPPRGPIRPSAKRCEWWRWLAAGEANKDIAVKYANTVRGWKTP